MEDEAKTKEQLLNELVILRQRVSTLKKSNLEGEELYRTLFETSPDAIALFDLNGKLIIYNRMALKIFGYYEEADLIGKTITEFIVPEERERKIEQMKTVLERDVVLKEEYCGLRKDGTTFSGEEMIALVKDVFGKPNFILAKMRDITERKRAEEELKTKTKDLEEANTALKVLLNQLEEGRNDLEARILSNIKELVLPYVNSLRHGKLSSHQDALVDTIESNLNRISSSFLQHLKLNYYNLTPREIEVANLVREGRSIKEIAALLRVTIRTVESHRKSLRTKMGLKNRKANLRAHLLSLQ